MWKSTANNPAIEVRHLNKVFRLHNQGGACVSALSDVSFQVYPGECVALQGESGAGKSTLLRCLHGGYRPSSGQIWISCEGGPVELTAEEPRRILAIRRQTLGYVSQFLRVVPRVPTRDVVAEPLLEMGVVDTAVRQRVDHMLRRLNLPEALWPLSPVTFSGGEQQRVNIARGLVAEYSILLLDEPTASLDQRNKDVVVELIKEAKRRGTAIVGIFHDDAVRASVADRTHELQINGAAV